jgi:citrate synthase
MTEECKIPMNTGLRGVTIASTRISDVDGDAGKLIYRGYLVKDLAENATFEEVAYLLLFERMPNTSELAAFAAELAGERSIPSALVAALETRPHEALPMDILQAGVAMLANHDPDTRVEDSREATLRMAIRLIAKMPTLLAA